jgi:hypothetical protein
MKNAVMAIPPGQGRLRLAWAVGGALLVGALPGAARAGEPVPFGPFRLTLGGEVSGSLAGRDDDHFNDAEYGHDVLRTLRIGICAELQAGPHLAALAEVRSDDLSRPRAYALYLRVRPWRHRAFDVQAGLVPPVFGAFPRQRYGNDPALIGYPLAYQYPTLVRADAAPSGVENLRRWRGRGWWVRYPLGATTYGDGLPLVSVQRWDTGVQAHLVAAPWELSAALTQGTLAHPVVRDDNGSKQLSGRAVWRSRFGLSAGVSAARGGYVSRDLLEAVPAARGRPQRQRALGVDVEQARGHWIVRSEIVWSAWDALAEGPPLLGESLTARAVSLEARYRPWPGVSLAARLERLDFGDVEAPEGPVSWDAPVARLETGVGYAFRHNLAVKLVYQYNRRDGGRLGARSALAVQGVAWF